MKREWPDLASWICDVWDVDPTGCDAEYAAFRMRGCEVRREIITRAREIVRDSYALTMSPTEYNALLNRLT